MHEITKTSKKRTSETNFSDKTAWVTGWGDLGLQT